MVAVSALPPPSLPMADKDDAAAAAGGVWTASVAAAAGAELPPLSPLLLLPEEDDGGGGGSGLGRRCVSVVMERVASPWATLACLFYFIDVCVRIYFVCWMCFV